MSTTGDRITHRGVEVVYVDTEDTYRDDDIANCSRCPFVYKKDKACETASCDGGYLLTVPDYVAWRLTK